MLCGFVVDPSYIGVEVVAAQDGNRVPVLFAVVPATSPIVPSGPKPIRFFVATRMIRPRLMALVSELPPIQDSAFGPNETAQSKAADGKYRRDYCEHDQASGGVCPQ